MSNENHVELLTWEMVGTPTYLGQDCPTCEIHHFCDAICFRFSPKIFRCPYCKVMKRHRPWAVLVRQYQAAQVLKGITTPGT